MHILRIVMLLGLAAGLSSQMTEGAETHYRGHKVKDTHVDRAKHHHHHHHKGKTPPPTGGGTGETTTGGTGTTTGGTGGTTTGKTGE